MKTIVNKTKPPEGRFLKALLSPEGLEALQDSHTDNVTRAVPVQRGIPRYLSQRASSTLTHSHNGICGPCAVWLLI